MIYGFEASGDREVIEGTPNIYIKPEKHPSRILDFHDIFYMVEGKWSVLLKDERIELRQGDVVLLPAGLHHFGDDYCRANTRTIFIHFKTKKGDGPWDIKKENRSLPVLSHTHPDSGRVFSLFQEMAKTSRSHLPHRDFRCSALLNQIIIELSDHYTRSGNKHDKVILELLNLFMDHPEKFFSIEELAAGAGLSRKSLTLRFRAETGLSVHQYQMNSKLDQIATSIRTNSWSSLKNLAYNFGFYDEYHLSSAFKKKFGISPGKYGR
ncbi:hypothetical protein AGMMS49928_11960 [Spirochaetia bacterium]|nr:hypothetical protein AGMMS49928_11960 [Spirochaetia bacterium]